MFINPNGVSLIICTYNGSELLEETLRYVLNQNVPETIEWEFLLIDNASTDNSQRVVREMWNIQVPCRIIYEGAKGLIHARNRGITEAKYEFISFIDDDNWIDKNWVSTIYDIFTSHPKIGICGGQIEEECEMNPPAWFEQIKESFAVGKQGESTEDVTRNRGYLWGAGLSLRKSAFEAIRSAGFKPLLTGRMGNVLLAGEDTEISFVMRMAGWKLWYDERLQMKHFIASKRLNWSYVVNIYKGFGYSHAIFEIYYLFFMGRKLSYKSLLFRSLMELLPFLIWRGMNIFSDINENPKRLQLQLYYSKFSFTVRNYQNYNEYYNQIKDLNEGLKQLGDRNEITELMKFSVITVCLNAERFIDNAIISVISQAGNFEIEYLIIDGGSHDQTLEIIERIIEPVLKDKSQWRCQDINFRLISEPDLGMYDALVKGFKMATGDIISYINADDFYLPGAFQKVLNTFNRHHEKVKWLTGIINIGNVKGSIHKSLLPFSYSSDYIQKGIYNGISLPFIQQESTFWLKELLLDIDFNKLKSFKFAGDYYLWHEFSFQARLYILPESLAVFRINENQKSSDKYLYLGELERIASKKTSRLDRIKILLHKCIWYASPSIKKKISKDILFHS